MPTFIILGNFTQKGLENVKDLPGGLEKAKELDKAFGGEMKAFYYTLGRYDFVAIAEFPDPETAIQVLLAQASTGVIKTETLVAVPAERGAELIDQLP